MSSLNFPGCNLSPLLLALPDTETKFILLSAQLFLKTSIFEKMCVELSLQGGTGTWTRPCPPEHTGDSPVYKDSHCSSRSSISYPTTRTRMIFCTGLVRLTQCKAELERELPREVGLLGLQNKTRLLCSACPCCLQRDPGFTGWPWQHLVIRTSCTGPSAVIPGNRGVPIPAQVSGVVVSLCMYGVCICTHRASNRNLRVLLPGSGPGQSLLRQIKSRMVR